MAPFDGRHRPSWIIGEGRLRRDEYVDNLLISWAITPFPGLYDAEPRNEGEMVTFSGKMGRRHECARGPCWVDRAAMLLLEAGGVALFEPSLHIRLRRAAKGRGWAARQQAPRPRNAAQTRSSGELKRLPRPKRSLIVVGKTGLRAGYARERYCHEAQDLSRGRPGGRRCRAPGAAGKRRRGGGALRRRQGRRSGDLVHRPF